MTSPIAAEVAESCLERFLRYVRIDTRSDEGSDTFPSTPGQLELSRQLADELRALGLSDVDLDRWGYVTASVPASPGAGEAPTVGFIAHVDTSPEMPGTEVEPLVHRDYDGADIVLPDDPAAVLRPAEDADLAAAIGDDLVTASGRTLLGADDKAGVAEIVTAAEYLLAHPEVPRPKVRIAFTPDEEVGRGADHFDVERFGADFAFTLDGGGAGELEIESFSADSMTVVFHGVNTHPGYAHGTMVNSIKVAADFLARLPRTDAPETTTGHQGYVHPNSVEASVERSEIRLLVRDFDTAELARRESEVERLAHAAADGWPGSRVEVRVDESYRNMREVVDRHPRILRLAEDAIRRTGLEPRRRPIRGGTDGSRLSFMGLPTPNLSSGQHRIHSRLEWASVREMALAVAVIVEICRGAAALTR